MAADEEVSRAVSRRDTFPCGDDLWWPPSQCPPADPRCTGCAQQHGMFAGLVRAIKRSCGYNTEPQVVVGIEAVLKRWILLFCYGPARANDGAGGEIGGGNPDWKEWMLTITQIVWKDRRYFVKVPGNAEDRMPAVYLVALLRYFGGYREDFPDVVELMATRQYRAGMRSLELQLRLRARELGLDKERPRP